MSIYYLLVKIGFDTPENEPFKVCPLAVYYSGSPRCGHCQSFVLHDGAGNPANAPLEKINKELSGDKLQVAGLIGRFKAERSCVR